jgi:hypothetical protein
VLVEAAADGIAERAQRADLLEPGGVHPVILSLIGLDKRSQRSRFVSVHWF